ncbi:MAG: DNA gyrase subunit A [Actinobacteria bacterium]|nr:DNA gyrase subunit A [Cyanobacteriota bacterium]MCL5771677.1 DNA gyrase subunit A [Actinomycetota bacterium]
MVFEIRGKIKNRGVEAEMQDSYLSYAMSVIIGRALPDARDGLKPVHRRILYAMLDMGMRHNTPYKKSARIVGEVLGKYHPHGDTAVYDSMVRMAQDFSIRYPLIDGHGNFGSIDGDSPAAMRYTEARLSEFAEEILADLDKETVEFIDNFDSSLKEPAILPAKIPNLLVNGSSGIAVGMATNVPPHNLGEIIDGVIAYINNKDISITDLLKHIKGPDFPTGGRIMGMRGIVDAYTTGRGIIRVRGRVHIEQTKKGKQQIIISEIPYQVNKTTLIEKIVETVKDKKIDGISDIRDESDKSGMRIVIEVKREADPNIVVNQLYKHSQLESTFGIIMIALVNGIPRTLSLKELISEFVKHRYDVVVKRAKYELKKAEERAHILEGLLIALDNLDAVIKLIRSSKDVPTAREGLMNKFGLTEIQAQAILDMRLQRLTALEREKIKTEHKELIDRIKYLKELLGSDALIYGVIKDELKEIKKKYNDERRTEITSEVSDLEIEDLIAEEENVISITHSGYIKRLPVTTYRKQNRGGRGVTGMNLKEEDFVEHLFISSTHNYIMFFSNYGKVYRLKVYEIPEGSKTSKGKAIVNILPFKPNEKVMAVIAVKEFGEDDYLIMATKKGFVKKTSIKEYDTSRKEGIAAITLKDKDELIKVEKTSGKDDIMLITKNGQAIRFSETDCRPMGRTAQGVIGMKLAKGDEILTMAVVRDLNSDLFILTDNGYGKRTPVSDFSRIRRGGKGVRAIIITEKKGKIAGAGILREDYDVMIMSTNGILIRVNASSISRYGRASQGVRIMHLEAGDFVASTAFAAPED